MIVHRNYISIYITQMAGSYLSLYTEHCIFKKGWKYDHQWETSEITLATTFHRWLQAIYHHTYNTVENNE